MHMVAIAQKDSHEHWCLLSEQFSDQAVPKKHENTIDRPESSTTSDH